MSPSSSFSRRKFLQAGAAAAGALAVPHTAAAAQSVVVDSYIGAIPLVLPLAEGTYQAPIGNNWHTVREGHVYPWNHRVSSALRAHDGVDLYPADGQPLPQVYSPLRGSVAAVCLRSANTIDATVTYKVSARTPPPWDYSGAVDEVAQLPLYGNFVWLLSADPASAGYFIFMCHLQNERALQALSPDQPVDPATAVGVVGDTGNAMGVPQLHVEIHYPFGTTFTCASCTPAKPGLTSIDSYASLKGASPRNARGQQSAAPMELRGAANGILDGSSGGSFAYYQVGNPTATSMLTLAYAPFDAVWAHGVGLAVYQGGALLGSATGRSTALGDPTSEAAARVSVSRSPSAAPLLVQVFNYGTAAVSYTLTVS